MVLGSGSHSRSQVLVANPWVKCHQLAGRNRLAVSHRGGTVLSVTTLPRTVDPPLNSIVLDQRRRLKVGPCLGKTTSGTWYRPGRKRLLSEHSCVRPSASTCNIR